MNYAKLLRLACKSLVVSAASASALLVLAQTDLQENAAGKLQDAADSDLQRRPAFQTTAFDYSAIAPSKQIPLCMIGDSITWAGEGDCWRKEMIRKMPNLAFVGTHSAVAGYSHAGEGGNSTAQILKRIEQIPDCPYYSLMVGTNNNGVKTEAKVKPKAAETAHSIIEIVHALLDKQATEKVFLSSILPCHTGNPLRDQCNSATNRILRDEFVEAFPAGQVIWVEYEIPLRKIDGWEEKIRLHPTPAGYNLIADITANSIATALNVEQNQTPVKPVKSGVRIVNLMQADRTTSCPIIAGWYTLSFKLTAVAGDKAEVVLQGIDTDMRFPFKLTIPIEADHPVSNQRVSKNLFTQYERYGYSRDYLELKTVNCTISEVLLEKSRPSMQSSVYGTGTYIDTASPTSPGELVEFEK